MSHHSTFKNTSDANHTTIASSTPVPTSTSSNRKRKLCDVDNNNDYYNCHANKRIKIALTSI